VKVRIKINKGDLTMNSARRPAGQKQQEAWPKKLNKALLAIGVIAFGLVITDRIIEMFSADDPPAVLAEVEPVQGEEAVSAIVPAVVSEADSDSVLTDAAKVITAVSEPTVSAAVPAKADDVIVVTDSQPEPAIDLQEIFGSRVVFVSASEPVYVVTEDDRRFDVGSEIDAQTTLAGVTAEQLTLEHAGYVTVINLPDPVVQ
jgi:hypothetical protein